MNINVTAIREAETGMGCFSDHTEGCKEIDTINSRLHWTQHEGLLSWTLRNTTHPDWGSIFVARTNIVGEMRVFFVKRWMNETCEVWQLYVYPFSKEIAFDRYCRFDKGNFAPVKMKIRNARPLGANHPIVNMLLNYIKRYGEDFKKEYSDLIVDRHISLFPGMSEFRFALDSNSNC